MNIVLRPNIVLTLIGPSHSGKSYYAKQIQEYLTSINKTCKIISSDELRKEMLHIDQTAEIPTAAGFAISDVVFKKLRADLNFYMTHPCNTDVIIVDTTGLDKSFREDIAKLAKEQSYANIAILFQLSKNTLFSRIAENSVDANHKRFYIEKQLTRLKEKVLPYFNKHDYMSVYRIDDKRNIALAFEYIDNTKVLNIDSGRHAIYGDIHQQVNEFESLFEQANQKGFDQHILIGDYLDKDSEESMKSIIKSVYTKCIAGNTKIIKANHEEYVYRNLKDQNYEYVENEETSYFVSLKYLLKPENIEYKELFFKLYEEYTYDYSLIKNERNYAYITHSPCLEMYIGKHSPKSLKMMRNTRFFGEDKTIKAVELMKPMLDESSSNKALHIFGHVEVGNKFNTYKNKFAIDTGCVSGGHLTALLYDVNTGKKEFISVKSTKESANILDFSCIIKQWSNRIELLPHQERQLRRLIKSNAAFISGTVSPSPSSTIGEPSLESVETAIELFKSHNITKVITQKKHMGSRCQVYLFKDRELCYATSRNGYKIKHPEIEGIIDKEFEKYHGQYETLLITDNELMPWSFLGKGLITSSFMPYYQAVNSDLEAMKTSGLKEFLGYSSEVYDNLEQFNKQVEIYGADVPGYLETFGIVYKDGQELITSNQTSVLSEFGIDFLEIDLENEDDIVKLHDFYSNTIADGITEGIVMKPVQWKKDDIPCIKIRNAEYLRIVYGFDYTSSLKRHAENKNIRNKLKLSIKEQNLNLLLLDAYCQGNKETQKEIYASLLTEFEKESSLDPRL